MKPGFVVSSAVLMLLSHAFSGCVATTEDVRGAYVRQARIEERVDQIAREVERLKAELGEARAASLSEAEIKRLQDKIARLEQAYRDMNSRVSQLEQTGVSGATMPGTMPSEPSGPAVPQAPSRSFDDAYKAFSRGSYSESRALFKEFIEKNPGSPQVADSSFWIAESYFREGRYEEAILEFQKFIDTYPKDQRVPLAYLKQGLSLININRKEEAKIFLQTLIDRYPRSEEAGIAKEKLRELALQSQ
ncbi:MAG: tol-pal system protein YbgF [Candidatus Caldarchaeum sp.]